jgi:hypothetical protein
MKTYVKEIVRVLKGDLIQIRQPGVTNMKNPKPKHYKEF